MIKKIISISLSIILMLVFNSSYAKVGFLINKVVSLYNIYASVLVYKYWDQSNDYLAMKAAYHINETWANKANWNIVYLSNGYVAFRNVDSKWLCMAYYGESYRPISKRCNYDDRNQQFVLKTVSTGAVMIYSANYSDQCLKQFGNSDDKALFVNCHYDIGSDIPKQELWALLPALSDATAL